MAAPIFQFSSRYSGTGSGPTERIRVNISQTILNGHMLIISSKKASLADTNVTADTVLGVAVADKTTTGTVADTDVIDFIPALPDIVWRVQFRTSGTKTSFTDADLHTKYDLNTTDKNLDPDDTTGGWLELLGYNNTDKVCFVRVDPSKLYLV